MVIDGNDDPGIDVRIMTQAPWEIREVRSHVEDSDSKGTIFSRDCPEYVLATKSGKRVIVLMNHLKSKGYVSPGETPDEKRERQAKRVASIYRSLRNDGEKYIAILGDFNDAREAKPLKPLFTNTGLKDISDHPAFKDGGFKGTYGRQGEKDKFDYVLLSPDLFSRVTGGGSAAWGSGARTRVRRSGRSSTPSPDPRTRLPITRRSRQHHALAYVPGLGDSVVRNPRT